MHLRSLQLLTLAALAGCASSPSPEGAGWREIQAQRLAKLHSGRDYASALARVRALAPTAAARRPQEPAPASAGKIDQRLPARIDAGPRRYHGVAEPVRIEVEGGVGNVEVIAPRASLSDRTEAAFLRVGIDGKADSAAGPGLRATGWSTDDDLFAGSQLNNGVVPRRAAARAVGVRVFPHLRLNAMHDSDWQMPIRLGLGVDYTDIEHDVAGVDRKWLTLGPRVEFEPQVPLLGSKGNRLDLLGRFGAGVGYGAFKEEFVGGDDDDSVWQWSYEAGVGLRWNLEDWWLDAGYEFGQGRMTSTDTRLYDGRGLRLEQQQVWLGGSMMF